MSINRNTSEIPLDVAAEKLGVGYNRLYYTLLKGVEGVTPLVSHGTRHQYRFLSPKDLKVLKAYFEQERIRKWNRQQAKKLKAKNTKKR